SHGGADAARYGDQEGDGALGGFEPGELEVAQQGADHGAAQINGEQGELGGEKSGAGNASGAREVNNQDDGGVGGEGGEPALAEVVIEAGRDFDGRSDREQYEGEGHEVVGGDEEAAGG